MNLSAFADEGAGPLHEQIALVRELGGSAIDLRKVGGVTVHDLDVEACHRGAAELAETGLRVTSLASAIGAGRSSIDDDPRVACDQARRCVERARIFGTRLVRVMSWPPRRGQADRGPDEPSAGERIRRLGDVCAILLDGGLQPVHENCHNYGGMGVDHTLRLLKRIPGLLLAFDTGNPVGTDDWAIACAASPEAASGRPKQRSWRFWCAVRDHVAQIHVKDAVWDAAGPRCEHCLPGDGEGDVLAVLADARRRGFEGPVSLEPHLGGADPGERRSRFLAAGRRLNALAHLLDQEAIRG
jgi:sugar phosphate isomerase/epimerase